MNEQLLSLLSPWTLWSIIVLALIYLVPERALWLVITLAVISGGAVVALVIRPAEHGISPLQYYAAIVGYLLLLRVGRLLQDVYRRRQAS